MATTTGTTSSTAEKERSTLEFPSRAVYVRTTNEDVQSPGHQERVASWIHDFEKNRQIFVFPSAHIRAFAGAILGLGLASLILQIASSSLRYAFVPSLLGSGIWIALFCVVTGAVGLAAAHHLSSSLLLDFTVMSLLASMLSAIVVVLNSIGMEMYTKLCYNAMLPTGKPTGIPQDSDSNSTTPIDSSQGQAQAPVHWIGECNQASFILMGIVVFVHVCLFLVSAFSSGYSSRATHSSFNVRAPPLVVYHSDTVEMGKPGTIAEGKAGEGGGPAPSGSKAGSVVEKMMEKLQGSQTTTTTMPGEQGSSSGGHYHTAAAVA